jgi:broad specificity phosphatase PhoE
MKPKRIILMRHGESEGNVDRGVYATKPDYALNLSDTGRAQGLAGGVELKELVGDESIFFYVSPMWRTRETFEEITTSFNQSQFGYIEEPRLREQEWGHLRSLEDCDRTDVDRDAYGTFYYRIPDGESAADCYDRVSDFFGTLHRDFAKKDFCDNAVMIIHGMTIRLFLMRWFHWSVEEFESYANPDNCQMVVLELVGDKYVLKSTLKKRPTKHGYQRPIVLRSR